MKSELNGKIALVTGASRGIGRAVARALAREGVAVAVNYRTNERAARETCDEIARMGGRVVMVQGDVSVASDVVRLVERVRSDLGPVAVLVNNAGIGERRSINEVTERDFDETVAVNLKGAFLATQAVLPDMREKRWGRIVSISSIAAQTGGVVGVHYASSKAGLLGLTHYYAANLVKEGITVNAIAPGAIATDMASGLSLSPDAVPVGRLGTVEEVARVLLMLVESGYITGQTISMNGGRWFS